MYVMPRGVPQTSGNLTADTHITYICNTDPSAGPQEPCPIFPAVPVTSPATFDSVIASTPYLRMKLAWTAAAGATQYRVQCKRKEESWAAAASFTTSLTEVVIGDVRRNTLYDWCVAGGNAANVDCNSLNLWAFSASASEHSELLQRAAPCLPCSTQQRQRPAPSQPCVT